MKHETDETKGVTNSKGPVLPEDFATIEVPSAEVPGEPEGAASSKVSDGSEALALYEESSAPKASTPPVVPSKPVSLNVSMALGGATDHTENVEHKKQSDHSGHGGHAGNVIIIRRIKKIKKGGHHGGSWKIAYADFVTAMMAFFLLMWLLGMMNRYQLEGIAEYFKKPLKEAFQHEMQKGAGQQKGTGPDKDKDKEKEKEKEKEKGAGISNKSDGKIESDKQKDAMNEKPKDLKDLIEDIKKKMEADPELRQFKNQLNFIITADGLKIQLFDLENKPMFTTGKADFETYAKKIVAVLGAAINKFPNRVAIFGHTDTAPYHGAGYSNWELSADRASATRRALVGAGMNEDKVIRVIGLSDTQLLDKKNGLNPSNRRIEIMVLTDEGVKKYSSY